MAWIAEDSGTGWTLEVDDENSAHHRLTLQPDSSLGQDTTLHQGNPDTNYGSDIDVSIGRGGSSDLMFLIGFDLSVHTTLGWLCNAATLVLYHGYSDNAGAGASSLYMLKPGRSDWAASEATYNAYKTGSAWATAGCADTTYDRDADAIGTFITGTYPETLSIPLDTDKVASCFGGRLSMLGQDDSPANWNKSNITSSDHSTPSLRPQLSLEFTENSSAPATATRKSLLGVGL